MAQVWRASPQCGSPRARTGCDTIRWHQLAGVVLIGVVIAAAGVVTNVALAWTDIWPQVFLTVGSAFALGGVLFVLQRSWVEEVSEEV